jgi:hypothetical protein
MGADDICARRALLSSVPPTVCPDVPGYSAYPDVSVTGGVDAADLENPSTVCNEDPACLGYIYVSESLAEDPIWRDIAGLGYTRSFFGESYPFRGMCLFVKLARKFNSERTHVHKRMERARRRYARHYSS